MRYINTLREGDTIRSIYLCKTKRSAETRNGKPYDNLTLQDKTGTLDGKVWDPNSGGIADYDEMDFVEVFGEVVSYNNNLQLNIKQLRKPFEDAERSEWGRYINQPRYKIKHRHTVDEMDSPDLFAGDHDSFLENENEQ